MVCVGDVHVHRGWHSCGPQACLCGLSLICLLRVCCCVQQALNLILLTAGEVRGLRDSLRDAATSEAGMHNFTALYPCWSHSAGESATQAGAGATQRATGLVSRAMIVASHF